MRKALFVLVACTLLAGCWDADELDHMYYSYSLGIDYKDDKYITYIQILNFSGLAKSEAGGGNQQAASWVGQASGETVDKSLHNLYRSAQSRVHWGHLTAIIFTKEALEHGGKQVVELMQRYSEIRKTMWMYATEEDLRELLNTSPILYESPVYSQIGNPTELLKQSTVTYPIRFHRYVAEMNQVASNTYMPNLTLREKQWSDEKRSYKAIEANGITVVVDHKFKASFTRNELNGLWFKSHARRIPLTIKKDGKVIADMILQRHDYTLTPTVEGDEVKFTLKVKGIGQILVPHMDVSEDTIHKETVKEIKNEIKSTYVTALEKDVDLYHLINTLHYKDPEKYKELIKNVDNPVELLTEDSLNKIIIDLEITNSGAVKLDH